MKRSLYFFFVLFQLSNNQLQFGFSVNTKNVVIHLRPPIFTAQFTYFIFVLFGNRFIAKKIKIKMERVLDTTQLVSGVAILLSFLAGYRYGLRNLDGDSKEEEGASCTKTDSAEKSRVSVLSIFIVPFRFCPLHSSQ